MNICVVETAADLRQFIEFPYWFYRDDTTWAPPLRSELRGQFDPLRNPFLQHCAYALFLLKNGEKLIGRAEDAQGKPIGFAIALPDVNVLLKKMNGRLLPFGWLRLFWGLPRLTQYRMFALGVIPEYHGKAVDSLLYRALYESCYSKNLRMEINYVLEDNAPMNNAILKLGARPLRKYRVYQRET